MGRRRGRGGNTADLGAGLHHRAARGGVACFPGAIGALGGVASRPRRPATGRALLLHGEEESALLFLLRAVGRERHHDALAQDVFILHALVRAFGRAGTSEPEHGAAAGHSQHLPSTVIGEALEPVRHSFGVAVCGKVVHKQKVACFILTQ